MEIFAWLGGIFILGLALTLFLVIRSNKLKKRREAEEQERQRQEAETKFIKERLSPFYHGRIKQLPIAEITLRWWWYQRLGFFSGPWKRFEKKKTFTPSENQIINAAYHYLKAVDAGEIRERNFTDQAALWVFVHENVKALFSITYS